MPGSAFEPIRLPEWVWHQDEVRDVLRRRDFGALFELAAKYGVTQTQLSAMTGIPQGRISQYKNSRVQINKFDVIETIADALGLPDDARMLLGLAPLHPEIAKRNTEEEARHAQHEELRARLNAASSIDLALAELMATETDQLRRLDRRLGAPALADKLRAHVNQVETALRHGVRPGVRRALARVLAETSSLAGWHAIDMCALADAWEHYERAKAAAREAEDLSVLAHVSGEQAYVLIDLGRPAEAVELLQDLNAGYRNRLPGRLQCWLAAAEAEAAAVLGDEATCRTALEHAERALPAGDADPALPYLTLSAAHLARWRGNCLVRFADTSTITDLRTALAAKDSTFSQRAEAALRCDLAHALLVSSQADEAREHITRARDLATTAGSTRQRHRIEGLARAARRSLS
ncbi:helix-turn-helix domain-containing protein [Bailinhaonella thermotolerans]|uniref:XRE family transcriptional regulator n=1 Tax=Bailinhaonella thermotolerans TaxID=1070861 RepID=A0A3A4BL97_9ACTN|nr:helix-turn-helix transcriptional regulator [Bailinhaonella thermotolerans]RJL31812.1 XRE family transcriptional regulator [Bailinhaonella thermotolerans]